MFEGWELDTENVVDVKLLCEKFKTTHKDSMEKKRYIIPSLFLFKIFLLLFSSLFKTESGVEGEKLMSTAGIPLMNSIKHWHSTHRQQKQINLSAAWHT